MTTLQGLNFQTFTGSAGLTGRAPASTQTALKPGDIDWAEKLDKKMEYGYVPSLPEQERYNQVLKQLHSIKQDGGYVYQDKTAFSSNPRGVAAVGSMVGKALSGGWIGYKYGGDMSHTYKETFLQVKSDVAGGNISGAFRSLGVGIKDAGVIAAKSAGISAVISAGAAVASNIFEMAAGRQTAKESVANVAADTVGGLLTGATASTFAGLSTLGLSFAGVTGLPLTILGVTSGAVGSLLMDKLYKASGLFTMLKNRVSRVIE